MSSDPTCRSTSRMPSPLLPTLTALGEVTSLDPESDGEVKQDQLAFTLKFPSRPQLQLFETVFNTGKPLVGYCQDDPLWPLLVEVASSCTNCSKSPDAALHARTSSTSTLLELNMLDEWDTADADQQELQKFLALQQGEATVTAKHKCDHSPLPVAGPSSKKIQLDAPKKCSHRRSPVTEAASESPLHVRLVVPLGQSVVAPTQPCSPSRLPFPNGASRFSPSAQTPIKGTGQDLLASNMPLTPRTSTAHPYRAENQCLIARLRSSSREVLEHKVEYRCVLDQFLALDEALLGTPGQSLLEHFRKVQEDLRDATRERKITVKKLSTSTHKNSQLMTTLLHQQSLVDKSNALATCQRRLVEELQEEVHCARSRATFVKQMIKEYLMRATTRSSCPLFRNLKGTLTRLTRTSAVLPPSLTAFTVPILLQSFIITTIILGQLVTKRQRRGD
ncbi:hypothetical protein EV368DRAFT_88706 [Lentinula lateritia]|nr:hypothetical protein EV368DRAFT_88706 [Lentinula lateritia]